MPFQQPIYKPVLLRLLLIFVVMHQSEARALTPGSPIALASGGYHSCALLAGGTVSCWGDNSYGQLGSHDFEAITKYGAYPVLLDSALGQQTPFQQALLTGAVAITVGNEHACALLSDGKVLCWGSNSRGQLGNGFVGVETGQPGQDGAIYVVGLGAPGTIAGLPRPRSEQNQLKRNIVATAISAGGDHTCALLNTKQVACWGDNSYGQAGQPNPQGIGQAIATPTIVNLDVPGMSFVDETLSTAVAAGASSTCVLTNRWGGLPMCWGLNGAGALGRVLAPQDPPFQLPNFAVPELTDTNGGLTQIVTNSDAFDTCTLSGIGNVYCWGDNSNGQLGDGSIGILSYNPQFASSGVSSVSVSLTNTCVIKSSRLQCWGLNDNGQLGFVDAQYWFPPTYGPTWEPIAFGVEAVSVGEGFICAIQNFVTVECLGSDMHGTLGRGYLSFPMHVNEMDYGSSIPGPVKFVN